MRKRLKKKLMKRALEDEHAMNLLRAAKKCALAINRIIDAFVKAAQAVSKDQKNSTDNT